MSSMPGPIVRPVGVLFAAMDRDADQVVSFDEAKAGIDIQWASIEAGSDRRVTAHEIADWAENSLGSSSALPNHMSFDFDLDGDVTETEFKERMRYEFGMLDKNGDRHITRDELLFELPNRRGRGGEGRGMRGGGGGDEGRGEGRGGGSGGRRNRN